MMLSTKQAAPSTTAAAVAKILPEKKTTTLILTTTLTDRWAGQIAAPLLLRTKIEITSLKIKVSFD